MSSKLVECHFCLHYKTATHISKKSAEMCTCKGTKSFIAKKRLITNFNKMQAIRHKKPKPNKEKQGLYLCDMCHGHGSYHCLSTRDNNGLVEGHSPMSRECYRCKGTGYVDWITNVKNKN